MIKKEAGCIFRERQCFMQMLRIENAQKGICAMRREKVWKEEEY